MQGAVRPEVHDAESELGFTLATTFPAGSMVTIDVLADVKDAKPGTYESAFDMRSGSAKALPWPAPVAGQDLVVR